MVTGFEEAVSIFSDPTTFSSCNALSGPFPGFPVPLEGDDVRDLVQEHRHELPMSEEMATMDPPKHTAYRGVVAKHMTPRHIRATEPFMRRTADGLIDQIVERGECELITDFSGPLSLLSICALLGVPESDHPAFVEEMLNPKRNVVGGNLSSAMPADPFSFLHERFAVYIQDRVDEPQNDLMSWLLNTPFPDGSSPTVMDAVRLASMLFIAGIGTTAGLLATSFQILGDDAVLQQRLREEPDLLPNFIEEVLRIDGEIKGTFRLSQTTKSVGGEEIAAGSTVMLVVSAGNRDPRKFECPDEFRLDRPNARQHLAFGYGTHLCLGAPLARLESRVGMERMLSRFDRIEISESAHGPTDARTYKYVPTYLSRSLRNLHLVLTPGRAS
jgi:cytochrome P450